MGKFLPWLQERIRHWVKPATSTLISGLLSDLARSRTELLVENALLRQQLIVLNRQDKRPQLTNPDRFWLVLLSHFTRFWRPSLHTLFSQIHSYAGIENCFAFIGNGSRKANPRFQRKRSA